MTLMTAIESPVDPVHVDETPTEWIPIQRARERVTVDWAANAARTRRRRWARRGSAVLAVVVLLTLAVTGLVLWRATSGADWSAPALWRQVWTPVSDWVAARLPGNQEW
jgi:TRAP-type C4-dicarboxylate transport system permease small subunit